MVSTPPPLRRGPETPAIVEADSGTNVGLRRTDAVGSVKAYPAEVVDVGFRLGVACRMRSKSYAIGEITADIARRDTKQAVDSAENMRLILTHAAALLQSLRSVV